ncbi:glycoside hydrolase [Polaribacter tangerinus]|uniref:glycoside hydrolase n=1 Tax=Polaribacter tangerinus TaxID=1920034 RepID=UPI000B4BE97F|nr:glycoside hydrolase [Polaribacter tangerinus]
MNKSSILYVFIIFIFLINCESKAQQQVSKININSKEIYQTIEGFGASDAWRCQFVGKNWPEQKRKKIARLLFSQEVDKQGNPEGIGLSIWRFYIGAGTTEQKDSSYIENEWRRSESFLDVKGNYDWTKQKGQQWFLNSAKKYGVDQFLAFSISAPVQWTKNGKGFNGDNKDGEINLKPEHFDDYAQFMVEFLKHFKSKGIAFDYLSPINEPQWDWEKKSQEGTPATNANILKISKSLNQKIEENNLSTKIVLGEAADLRWLYSDFGKPERGNQIEYFFNPNNKIENVKQTISGHSYFTTWPVDSLISIRKKLNTKLKAYNLNYWQSEFCILENTDDIGGGWKRDLGINTALYVARVIHADLTIANASSWQWWTALTNANFKDGLIYLDTGDQKDLYNLNKMKSDGNFHDSKLLWAFGNFSRFIRPNMQRIKIQLNEKKTLKKQYKDLMLSAYIDKKTSKLVIVAINYSDTDKTIDFSGYNIQAKYETSKDKNLEHQKVTKQIITVSGRSVNTLIGSTSK